MKKTLNKKIALLLALAIVLGLALTTPAAAFATQTVGATQADEQAEVRKENGGMESKNGITKISDLNGKTIGVQTGVLYEDEIKDEIDGETWEYYKMPNDMIAALEANKIDAYLIEEVGFYAQRYEHPELMRLEEKAGQSEFAVIIGNPLQADAGVHKGRQVQRLAGPPLRLLGKELGSQHLQDRERPHHHR